MTTKATAPKPEIKATAEVILLSDPRHPSNPDHPDHERWKAKVATQRQEQPHG